MLFFKFAVIYVVPAFKIYIQLPLEKPYGGF